ncbi:GlpG protein (membrane protein of glp regulon) [Salmonella enterica subsp. arizonae]|uniref:GlpG protein (Membrane protein of glp regulon) n=1 Tax=Salmonella enterica subsp. arizonae TaxID=59203 RepID=A0A379T6Y1_SALER|nr:GlpG protein (membrane protein of glp regulon) [Salmonella enterica subsp. arizonae]
MISALLSGYVQQKFSGPWFGGLSGVVYALMGYVWLRGERDPQSGIYLQRGLIIFALLWIVAGWLDWFWHVYGERRAHRRAYRRFSDGLC